VNKSIKRRIVIVAVVVGLGVIFKVLGLGQYFTLSYIKISQEKFATLYSDHRLISENPN
jgi:hypothetical protein